MFLLALAAACEHDRAPVTVQVLFRNTWTISGVELTDEERRRIQDMALRTLRGAFAGFDVHVGDAEAGHRIVVEDTPYSSKLYLGSVGVTVPTATVSSVRIDSLYYAELGVLRCETLVRCPAKTRDEIITGLGTGIGATAAHELGHQRGLEFTRHSACDECYDGTRATSYQHFFGEKHWSADALKIMTAVLPRRLP